MNIDSLGWEDCQSSFDNFSERDKNYNASCFAADNIQKCGTDITLNLQRYKAIIERCRERNVNVILVSLPKTNHFLTKINESQLRHVQEEGSQIEQQYENVTYVNFFNDTNFHDDDFYNANHLNPQVAKKVTLILDSIIENPILTKPFSF